LPEGHGVLDVYEVLATAGACPHALIATSSRPPEFELPAPEALRSPEFQRPDVALPVHGFAEGIAWLNRTIAVFEGEVNPGLRTLVVSARALVPTQSATV
jgi:hypothetical protein